MYIAANSEDNRDPDQPLDQEEKDPDDPDTFEPFDCFAVQYINDNIFPLLRNPCTVLITKSPPIFQAAGPTY